MKNIFYIKTAVFLVAGMLALTSCLKENKSTYVDFTKNTPLIELPLAAYKSNAVQKYDFKISDAVDTIPVVVNLASPSLMGNPITVTLAVDNSGLSSSYVALPTTAYTVSSLTTTIPANQRTAQVNFYIKPSVIGTTIKNYALRVKIADGGGIQISNYNTLVYNVTAH